MPSAVRKSCCISSHLLGTTPPSCPPAAHPQHRSAGLCSASQLQQRHSPAWLHLCGRHASSLCVDCFNVITSFLFICWSQVLQFPCCYVYRLVKPAVVFTAKYHCCFPCKFIPLCNIKHTFSCLTILPRSLIALFHQSRCQTSLPTGQKRRQVSPLAYCPTLSLTLYEHSGTQLSQNKTEALTAFRNLTAPLGHWRDQTTR